MMTITLVLFGLIALRSLKVNLLPDLSYPTLTVRTEYTGAAPTEIETLITQPVEEAVGVVKGLRKLKSVSRTGQSDVVLEFAWGTDMDQASLEVRDKMESLQLPLEAKAPVLLRFNPSTEPIMRLALTAEGRQRPTQLRALTRTAPLRRRRPQEEARAGRRRRRGQGRRRPRGRDPGRHRPAEAGAARPADRRRDRAPASRKTSTSPAAASRRASQRYLVRTVNQFASVDEIGNMLVTTQSGGGGAAASAAEQMARVAAATGDASAMAAAASVQSASSSQASVAGGMPVRLKDIADVRQGYKEREAIIRLGGNEAVELAIYKEGDANTVATADAIQKRAGGAQGSDARRTSN